MTRGHALFAAILLTACGSGVATTDGATPAPEKGKPGVILPTDKPSGLIYRPAASSAYRLERHDSLTLQYPGGAVQQQVRDRIAFFHVTVGEAGAGTSYPLTIVLDSLQALENGQPADSAMIARGTRWTGALTPDGRLSELKADRGGSLSDEISGRLRTFFPRLPATGVRQGMEWSDSSEYKLVADAFPGTERQVTTYRAAENSGPRKGVVLESNGTYARAGTRLQGDQSLEMTATGARHAVYVIGGDGAIVSVDGSDSGDMTITVPAVGQTVPVKQSGSYSIAPAAR